MRCRFPPSHNTHSPRVAGWETASHAAFAHITLAAVGLRRLFSLLLPPVTKLQIAMDVDPQALAGQSALDALTPPPEHVTVENDKPVTAEAPDDAMEGCLANLVTFTHDKLDDASDGGGNRVSDPTRRRTTPWRGCLANLATFTHDKGRTTPAMQARDSERWTMRKWRGGSRYLDLYAFEEWEDSPGEDDDEDSAEAQARAYDRETTGWTRSKRNGTISSCPHLRLRAHRADSQVAEQRTPGAEHTPGMNPSSGMKRARARIHRSSPYSKRDLLLTFSKDTLAESSDDLIRAYEEEDAREEAMMLWMSRHQVTLSSGATRRTVPDIPHTCLIASQTDRRAAEQDPLFLPDDYVSILPLCADTDIFKAARALHPPRTTIFAHSLRFARYFDLDAQDADSEEDEPETPADKAFIDDAPLAEGTSTSRAHAPRFLFDDSDAEQMAAEIVERSRKSRGLGASAAGTLFVLKWRGHSIPTNLALARRSRAVLRQGASRTKFSFLLWLYGLVPNEQNIPTSFRLPPPRHTWRGGRYGGDLVLITRVDYGLVVPRIKPVEDEQEDAMRAIRQAKPGGSRKVRPAPKLFYTSEQAFNSPTIMGRVTAGNPINKEVLYGNWCFLDGLLLLQLTGSELDQGNVRPTEAELEFFHRVHIPEVDFRDNSFPTLALAEGDRFVTKDLGPGRTSGYILAIRQVGSQRMAACRRHFNGTQRLAKQHVERYIPVHSLDHHILRIPRVLDLLDRVIVVDGDGEIGQLGRVIDVALDGMVTFQPIETPPTKSNEKSGECSTAPNTSVSCPMAHLSICFQCGDWVEVRRGPHAQRKGFVIGLRAGGVAEVYDPNRAKFNAVTLETIPYDHGDLIRDPNQTRDINVVTSQKVDPYFVVPTHSLKFAYRVEKTLADWGATMPDAGKHVTETLINDPILMKVVASNMAIKDKTMRDFITKHVRVIGGKKTFKGNNYKGRYGFVVGGVLVAQKGPNKNSKDWESPETQVQKILRGVKVKSAWEGATMSIRLENSQSIIEVAIEHLEDRHKKMPLVQTAYVEWEGPLRERTPSPPLSWSPIWTGPDVPRDPAEQRALDAASAESNGQWLTQIELVDKRVDIVVDTSVITPYWHANWSQAASNANGHSGYVIIPPNFKYEKKKANAKLGLPLKNVGIPVNNLRPQRTMYEQHIHAGRESIAAVEVRVIIIGPDVNGDQTHLGEYAQTMPSEHAEVQKINLTDVNPMANDCGDEGGVCIDVSGDKQQPRSFYNNV
ncbi:hypothetical protein B0H13DRAFT_2386553 [Mycena leptocephala]|nr:hypothetical protein B0H13DRAFT_2386553 [Mycena leptocephala]